MATGDIAQTGGLGNLVDILSLFKGKSATQTSTTKSNISPEGVDALLKQILGSTQGLGAVASGQKSAGLYNSSTNQQLINDLLSRTAGEVAMKQAGTTTSTVTNQAPQFGMTDILGLIGGAGAQKVLNPVLSAASKKLGLNDLGTTIADTIFGSGSMLTENAIGGSAMNAAMSGGSALLDSAALSSAGAAFGAEALGAFGGATAIGLEGLSLGGSAIAADAGALAAESLLAAEAGTAAGTAAATAGLAEAGTAVAGEAIGAEALLALFAWVICTELKSQGRLAPELYEASARRALTLSKNVMDGYHWWAIPFTRAMRRSSWLSKMVAPIAVARCKYLLGSWNFIGWLTVAIGEPICAGIGMCVNTVPDWKDLYGHA